MSPTSQQEMDTSSRQATFQEMSPTNGSHEETFFNLKTLTLRDRASEGGRQNVLDNFHSSDSVHSSQQRIISQSPSPSSHSYLWQVRAVLQRHWKYLTCMLIAVSYIIFIVSLHAQNYQLIQTNTRLMERQVEKYSYLSKQQQPSKYQTQSTSVKLVQKSSDDDEGGFKNLLLSISSQQSQINKLRQSLDSANHKLRSVQSSLQKSKLNNLAVFQSFLRESNISMCGEAGTNIVAPVGAIYRLQFSAKVHGNTYINRKMFEIRKNTQQLRNGGVIRIKYNGSKNLSVDCSISDKKKTCFYMKEILLVNLKSGDNIQVIDLFTSEGGHVYDLKFCMTITDLTSIPGDEESLVVTHK